MTRIRLLDRLSGQVGAAGPEPVLLGRFVLAPQSGEVRINGLSGSDYDPLFPHARGGWRLSLPGRFEELAGTFADDGVPAERWRLELDLVVHERHVDGFAADETFVLLPVDEAVPSELKEQRKRVRSLEERLPNLERVLCAPESAIGEAPVVLGAARARRLAPGAVAYLARHSEDWTRLAFGRPVPSRLLAVETFDDLDIYENRLALHARDEIERLLDRRLEQAGAQANLLERVAGRLGDEGLDWRPRERLARLLGSQESLAAAERAEGRIDRLKEETKKLGELRAQVRRLDSALLSAAMRSPAKRRVADFHLVNRLAVHADYREVGILFSQWVAGRVLDASARYETDDGWRRTTRQYDTFVAMLICKAFRELGLAPPGGAELKRGGPPLAFQLRRPYGSSSGGRASTPSRAMTPAVELCWRADGTLTLHRMIVERGDEAPSVPGEPVARIVPLIDSSLPVSEAQGGVADWIRRDLEDGIAARLWVVTPSGEDRGAALEALPDQGPFVLTASPRAFDGAERVVHLLRKLLWEPALANYPHAVNIDLPIAEVLTRECPDWLRRVSTDRDNLLRTHVAVDAAVPMPAADLRGLVRKAAEEAHQALGGRERGRRAEEVVQALFEARAWHGWWALCPLCGADTEYDDRTTFGEGFFRHRCASYSCQCRWEVLQCVCGRRTGIIEPHDMASGDRSYGALNGDLLARPITPGSGHRWRCERCFVSAAESVAHPV